MIHGSGTIACDIDQFQPLNTIVPADEAPVVADDRVETARQLGPLDVLTPIEADGLGCITQPDQRVTECGVELFVVEAQPDQGRPSLNATPVAIST